MQLSHFYFTNLRFFLKYQNIFWKKALTTATALNNYDTTILCTKITVKIHRTITVKISFIIKAFTNHYNKT